MIHQKILKFLEGKKEVPTSQIYRHIKVDKDVVLDELVKLKRAKQIDSCVHWSHGMTGEPYAVWWVNNGPKV